MINDSKPPISSVPRRSLNQATVLPFRTRLADSQQLLHILQQMHAGTTTNPTNDYFSPPQLNNTTTGYSGSNAQDPTEPPTLHAIFNPIHTPTQINTNQHTATISYSQQREPLSPHPGDPPVRLQKQVPRLVKKQLVRIACVDKGDASLDHRPHLPHDKQIKPRHGGGRTR